MTNPNRVAPDQGATLHADLSAADIDVRCALVLARIALQTLAELHPEAEVRIKDSLDHAIADAALEGAHGAEAVIGLLTEFKTRLAEEAERSRVLYLE